MDTPFRYNEGLLWLSWVGVATDLASIRLSLHTKNVIIRIKPTTDLRGWFQFRSKESAIRSDRVVLFFGFKIKFKPDGVRLVSLV